ncbi:MAG TPA: nucleoside triphosphate pyrophosphatase [Patescibacteria group bacterium]|nr:nucleoside triphosphate pyrophosphatase [Patescibacteria group bacterium]
MTRQIILASGSPRRKDLLKQMRLVFTAIPSDFEEHLDHSRPTIEVAKELGLGKARAVAESHPEAIVIGSDTIVTIGGKQLGKPVDESEARDTLMQQAGEEVTVTTSVVVICIELGLEIVDADEAIVQFKPYSKAEHEKYLATGDWADKAGSWGIQSGAAALIENIQGNYDTILGLPTILLSKALQSVSVESSSLTLAAPVPHK